MFLEIEMDEFLLSDGESHASGQSYDEDFVGFIY